MIKKNYCQYCGKNPVPHFLYWYFESSNVLLQPVRNFLLDNFITNFFEKLVSKFSILEKLVNFCIKIGFIKIQENYDECKIDRAKVLWSEGLSRGVRMVELKLFGKSFDSYIVENKKNQKKIIFSGLPRPENYKNSSLDWMDDKWLLKKKLISNCLPVPKGGYAWNFLQAKEIFKRVNKPIIVKPRMGSRGRHTTTFVNSEADLTKAFKIAKQLCFWVVVEEQLFGPVYRATLINYELCGVLRGDPPSVVGDGKNSIEKLIEIKNNQNYLGVKQIKIDSSTELFLSRQKLTLSTILIKDQVIFLSEKVGVNYGGSSSEDFDICHFDNRELFVNASRVIGDPIVGFDFIIPDITKSWKDQRCGFIEANSLPFINLHHTPLFGKSRNVAGKVWDMVGM